MRTPKNKKHPESTPEATGSRIWTSMTHCTGQSGIPRWLLQQLKGEGCIAFRSGSRIHEVDLLIDLEHFLATAEPETRLALDCKMVLATINWHASNRR